MSPKSWFKLKILVISSQLILETIGILHLLSQLAQLLKNKDLQIPYLLSIHLYLHIVIVVIAFEEHILWIYEI